MGRNLEKELEAKTRILDEIQKAFDKRIEDYAKLNTLLNEKTAEFAHLKKLMELSIDERLADITRLEVQLQQSQYVVGILTNSLSYRIAKSFGNKFGGTVGARMVEKTLSRIFKESQANLSSSKDNNADTTSDEQSDQNNTLNDTISQTQPHKHTPSDDILSPDEQSDQNNTLNDTISQTQPHKHTPSDDILSPDEQSDQNNTLNDTISQTQPHKHTPSDDILSPDEQSDQNNTPNNHTTPDEQSNQDPSDISHDISHDDPQNDSHDISQDDSKDVSKDDGKAANLPAQDQWEGSHQDLYEYLKPKISEEERCELISRLQQKLDSAKFVHGESLFLDQEILEMCIDSKSSMLDEWELACLCTCIKNFDWKKDDYIIEIGTNIGRTAVLLAKILKTINRQTKIISIDPFSFATDETYNPKGNYFHYITLMHQQDLHGICIPVTAYSQDISHIFRDKVGLLFVDGSHQYDDVIKDLNYYSELVKVNGYVFVDDYGIGSYPGVYRAFEEWLATHDNYEVAFKEDYFVLAKKISD